MTLTPEPDYLRCDACPKPVAEVRGATLRILARHHSKWHLTVLSVEDVEALLERMRAATAVGNIDESDTSGYSSE